MGLVLLCRTFAGYYPLFSQQIFVLFIVSCSWRNELRQRQPRSQDLQLPICLIRLKVCMCSTDRWVCICNFCNHRFCNLRTYPCSSHPHNSPLSICRRLGSLMDSRDNLFRICKHRHSLNIEWEVEGSSYPCSSLPYICSRLSSSYLLVFLKFVSN